MQKNKNTKFHKGFTLIEIAIVVIVVGLLIAGVLGGQEVIKVMKINSVISKMNEVTIATNSFKSKYDALPGDMPDAIDYWGILPNTDGQVSAQGNCVRMNVFNPKIEETCNGNGNSRIEYGWWEHNIFWQHLRNSGFNEAITNTDMCLECGYYLNFININNWNIAVAYLDIKSGDFDSSSLYNSKINYFIIGGFIDGVVLPVESIIKFDDAFILDSKMDDGFPNSGIVKSFNGGGDFIINCSPDPGPNEYKASIPKCTLKVETGF